MYLERIAAYDKKGPALNVIVVTNPDALKLADTLDARFVQSGPIGRSCSVRRPSYFWSVNCLTSLGYFLNYFAESGYSAVPIPQI